MIRFILFFGLLFYSGIFVLQAQSFRGGEVIYSKEIKDGSSLSGTDSRASGVVGMKVEQKREETKKSLEGLSYVLRFNTTESIFELQTFMKNQGRNFSRRAIALGDGDGLYYTDLSVGKVVHSLDLYGEEYLITEGNKTEWKVTSEVKNIGEFRCRKAVGNRQIRAVGKNLKPEIVEVEEIAWFCPEIPFSFGPAGRYGLPGLILELEVRNVIYKVKEIDFKKDSIILSEPKDGKVVSEEEFEDIISKFLYEFSNGRIGEG